MMKSKDQILMAKTIIPKGFIANELLWETSYKDFKKICSPLRTKELFDWLFDTYNYLFLSSVDPQYISTLADIKTTLCIIDTAVDDACDNAVLIEKNGGEKFTRSILGLIYNIDMAEECKQIEFNIKNKGKYYEIAKDILENSIDFIKSLPRFYEFVDEFILAMRNVAYSNEFCYCVNTSKIVYPFSYIVENRSPSTMVVVHSILDLMCSPDFDKKELGKVIPLFMMADTVAMLSNTISTWSREILERDYSSPVLALALERGLIEFNDFQTCDVHEFETKLYALPNIIEIELNNVLSEMEEYSRKAEIQSFNAFEFIDNYNKVKESYKIREKYWTDDSDEFISNNLISSNYSAILKARC